MAPINRGGCNNHLDGNPYIRNQNDSEMDQETEKEMILKLFRETFTDKSTIGQLYIDGKQFCFTLEDVDRKLENGGKKIYGQTCIPRGKYEVIIDFSTKRNMEVPWLKNVPQFTDVQMHIGNRAEDSEGCILVGSTKGQDFVGNSRATFARLMEMLDAAYVRNEPISLEII